MIKVRRIFFIDRNEEMVDAWNDEFEKISCLEACMPIIGRGDIFEAINMYKIDAIVSPANSFGFMDGGLDRRINEYYKKYHIDIQAELQTQINNSFHGELLVGQAAAVRYFNRPEHIPYLIAAPTMRVPQIISETANVYLAAKAVFMCMMSSTGIYSVAIPGLGTGVGQMPYKYAARQMRKAFEDIILERYQPPKNWGEAQCEHHQALYTDLHVDLQYKKPNKI